MRVSAPVGELSVVIFPPSQIIICVQQYRVDTVVAMLALCRAAATDNLATPDRALDWHCTIGTVALQQLYQHINLTSHSNYLFSCLSKSVQA